MAFQCRSTRGNRARAVSLLGFAMMCLACVLTGFGGSQARAAVAPPGAPAAEPARIKVNGVTLSYVEQGSGPTLLLIHGGLGDYSTWQPQMEPFAKSFRVIAYSRRYAYPNTNPAPPPNYSLLTEIDDLAAFISALGLKEAHMVGQSVGAFIALGFTLRHPAMVKSLVLSEPPVYPLIRATKEGQLAYQDFLNTIWIPAGQSFREHDSQEAMRRLVNGISGANRFDSMPTAARAVLMRSARAMEAHCLSPEPFPDLAADDLRHLRVPALVVTGEKTIRIHKLVNAELARLIPNAQSITVPNAGHGSPRENAAAFNNAALNFLTRAP